jgi:hypothetical protein
MANDYLTIADNVADACDLADNELVELKDAAPLLARIPMVESSNGATHKYSKRTANPVVGFRTENDGREFDHSVDTVVTVTLKILDTFSNGKAVDSRNKQRCRRICRI